VGEIHSKKGNQDPKVRNRCSYTKSIYWVEFKRLRDSGNKKVRNTNIAMMKFQNGVGGQ